MVELNARGIGEVHKLYFLPGQRLMATGHNGICVWYLADYSRKFVRVLNIWSAVPSPDGSYIVASAYERPMMHYSLDTLELLREFPNGQSFSSGFFHQDGRHFIGWDVWENVGWKWWRTDTWELIEPPGLSPNQVPTSDTIPYVPYHTSFRFSEDGEWAVSYGMEAINLLHILTRVITTIHLPITYPVEVRFTPDSSKLIAWSMSRLYVYDIPTKELEFYSVSTRSRLRDGCFTPDGRYLLMVGNDKLVHMLDAETWQVVQVYTWPISRLRTVAVSPDGLTAATGGVHAKVILWDWEI